MNTNAIDIDEDDVFPGAAKDMGSGKPSRFSSSTNSNMICVQRQKYVFSKHVFE